MSTYTGQAFVYRVLVVDDNEPDRNLAAKVLRERGFDVRTAEDGFAALLYLRAAPPDIIITDLEMPRMSGFELLSVVRKRFPQIPVIALSGHFHDVKPAAMLADAFFRKSGYPMHDVLERIADLLSGPPLRAQLAKPETAPVWFPTTSIGYYVLTCTECLRSFSVPETPAGPHVREARCIHCGAQVRYLVD